MVVIGRRVTELEELLKKALEEIVKLKTEIVNLKKENIALKEKITSLNKNSSNSSKPPSSDIVKPPAMNKGKGKRKRKIGAQKGNKKHERQVFEKEQIDKIISLTLEICPECEGELQSVDEGIKKHQQIELTEKPFIVTEYQRCCYWCKHCQCYHEAKLPLEVKRAGLFGQNLISLTAYLKGRCHMSYKTMQSFFFDVFGLKVSTGFLANQIYKASNALKTTYDNFVDQLPKTEHVHIDETGNKENGENRWTWCFRAKDFTVFYITPFRNSGVLEQLLSKDYAGIISSDFHSLYRKFNRISNARFQFCWAHLIREVKYLSEHSDKDVSAWGKSLLEEIRKMFSTYHRRAQLSCVKYWLGKMRSCKESILKIALYQVPSHSMALPLSVRFRDWQGEYFRFIDDDALPPTNNLCEQSIRHVVIDRKITQGTRSDWGNRWSERIWSVLATCKQRNENVLSFIRSCVGTFLQGFSPPSFLVE